MAPELPTLLHRWEGVLQEILDRTEKFPKSSRFTWAQRIDGACLDVYLRLSEARFARDKIPALEAASQELEKVRVMLRLAHGRRYLSTAAWEHVARQVDDAGRMLGGWIRAEAPARAQR